MRFVRVLLLVCAALFGASACANATAMASNKAGVFVTVNPGTVTAGSPVQIQASCGGSTSSATVTSAAFGSVTLQSSAASSGNGATLAATATVSATTAKGTFDVRLNCGSGSQATTTITITNSAGAQPTNVPGPNTGGGFLANNPNGVTGTDRNLGPISLLSDPTRRGPLLWLGGAAVCLFSAMVIALRRPSRRARKIQLRGQDSQFSRKSDRSRPGSRSSGSRSSGHAALLDPDKVPLVPPSDPWSSTAAPPSESARARGAAPGPTTARR